MPSSTSPRWGSIAQYAQRFPEQAIKADARFPFLPPHQILAVARNLSAAGLDALAQRAEQAIRQDQPISDWSPYGVPSSAPSRQTQPVV